MLTAETKALLEPGCALVIGLTAPDGEPLAARGWGITLLPGDLAMRLIIDAEIRDVPWLVEGGQLAVTGGDVVTLRSVQVKGQILRIEPVTAEDRVHAADHAARFIDDVARADGTDRALLERMVPDDYFACEATIVELYDQTPGPGAGASLEGQGA